MKYRIEYCEDFSDTPVVEHETMTEVLHQAKNRATRRSNRKGVSMAYAVAIDDKGETVGHIAYHLGRVDHTAGRMQ